MGIVTGWSGGVGYGGEIGIFDEEGNVDPEDDNGLGGFIAPAMELGAGEGEGVAFVEDVGFVVADPESEFAGKDVDKLFARVGVGFFAATRGLNFDALGLQSTSTGD